MLMFLRDLSESNPVTIIIELKRMEIILLYAIDGRLLKTLTVKDLKNVGGTSEVNLSRVLHSCYRKAVKVSILL